MRKIKTLRDFLSKNPGEVPYGYLSPDGTFYYVEYLGHISFAHRICEAYGYDEGRDPQDALEQHGWVHITVTRLFGLALKVLYTGRLNDIQKDELLPLMIDPPIPFDKFDIDLTYKRDFPDVDFSEGVNLYEIP